MAFLEIQFPPGISRGATGGPAHKTSVVAVESGFEVRNQAWSQARRRYDAAHGVKSQADLDELLAFFLVAAGRRHDWRWKDWLDFQVSASAGRLGTGAAGTGHPTYQLYKRYNNAAGSIDRLIAKPVSGEVAVLRNASPVTVGASAGNIAIASATGIITFVADSAASITAISNASPGVITAAAHGFSTGNLIYLSGIGGMTELNATVVSITVLTSDTFSIGVNTTGYGTFTSGGSAAKYPQAADALTWSGEFDVPARFDTDEMQATVDDYGVYSWGQIPVIEVRL